MELPVYRGVRFVPRLGRWEARIIAGRRRCTLGTYENAEQAALVYDAAARHVYGEQATLNFPQANTVTLGLGMREWLTRRLTA